MSFITFLRHAGIKISDFSNMMQIAPTTSCINRSQTKIVTRQYCALEGVMCAT